MGQGIRHDGEDNGIDDTIDAGTSPSGDRPARATPSPSGESTLPTVDAAPRPDHPALTTVDPVHYVRGTQVARGGMGRIIRARDRRLGRVVAIKELLPGRSDARERFELEARITARLQHPSIVSVLEAGAWPDGEPFYAMKLVAGRALDQEIAARPTLAARLELVPRVIAVADALAYAHQERVIHRDLKPANVLIGEFGETVVIDWGLAKDLANPGGPRLPSRRMPAVAAPRDGDSGKIVGTPAYMSPEQAQGLDVDERGDVYALGALLYHVLAGHPPYDGQRAQDVLDMVVRGTPVPADLGELGCPRDLVTIVAKAMAREREQRYPSARELAKDLQRFQTGQLVGAREYSAAERLVRWMKRQRAPLVDASLALAALATLGTLSVRRILVERASAESERREAVRRRDELYGEQARRESLAGHSGPALVYLNAAGDLVGRSPSLRLLAAENERPFLAQELPRIDVHGGQPVRVADFSPDSQRVLSAGADGTVVVSGAGSGTTKQTLHHQGPVRAALWAEDGRTIVSASDDGTVVVWDADSGQPRRPALDAAAGPVLALAASNDASLIAAAYARGPARLWRGDGTPVTELPVAARVLDVALAPDGKRVATAESDGVIELWDAATGQRVATLTDHDANFDVLSVRFAPGGPARLLSASEDHTARVWDGTTGAPLLVLTGHRSEVWDAEWSEDGTRVVTASLDGSAAIWDAASGARLLTLEGHEELVRSARFSRDGLHVVTASSDQSARVWDARTGFELQRFEGHRGQVRSAVFSSHATHVVTAGEDGSVRVWSVKPPFLPLAHGAPVLRTAFAPGGGLVASASADRVLRVWRPDPIAPTALAELASPADVLALAWSEAGELVTGDSSGVVSLWDWEAKLVRSRHGGGAPVHALAVSAGGRFAAGHEDGTLELWRKSRDTAERIFHLPEAVRALAFSPDGTTLWAAAGRRVRAFDVESGAEREDLALPAQWGPVEAIAIAPDGRRLATVALASATVWTLPKAPGKREPPRQLAWLPGRGGRLYALAFDPSGGLLATGSDDGTVEVSGVDALGGRSLALRRQHGPINDLAFSPDGRWLAAASDDGVLRLWSFEVDDDVVTRLPEIVRERVPWTRVDSLVTPLLPAAP